MTRTYPPDSGAAPIRLRALVAALGAAGSDVTVLTTRPAAGSGPDAADRYPTRPDVRRWPVLRDAAGRVRGYLSYTSFDLPAVLRLASTPRPDAVVAEPPADHRGGGPPRGRAAPGALHLLRRRRDEHRRGRRRDGRGGAGRAAHPGGLRAARGRRGADPLVRHGRAARRAGRPPGAGGGGGHRHRHRHLHPRTADRSGARRRRRPARRAVGRHAPWPSTPAPCPRSTAPRCWCVLSPAPPPRCPGPTWRWSATAPSAPPWPPWPTSWRRAGSPSPARCPSPRWPAGGGAPASGWPRCPTTRWRTPPRCSPPPPAARPWSTPVPARARRWCAMATWGGRCPGTSRPSPTPSCRH